MITMALCHLVVRGELAQSTRRALCAFVAQWTSVLARLLSRTHKAILAVAHCTCTHASAEAVSIADVGVAVLQLHHARALEVADLALKAFVTVASPHHGMADTTAKAFSRALCHIVTRTHAFTVGAVVAVLAAADW